MSDHELHELMVCRVAEEMTDDGITLLGSFTPLAYAAYMLGKRTHARDAWLFGYNAVGMQPVRLTFVGSEAAAYRGSVARWSFPETIHAVHLGKRGLLECVSSAQLDTDGAINLSTIGDRARPKVRLPGGAGSPEVVQNYRKLVAYFTRHDRRTFVPKVDFATGRRSPLAAEARQAAGLLPGPILVVTPLAVLRKDDEARPFALESVHPGVEVEEVVAATGFDLELPTTVPTTVVPTAEQLRLLREEIDPDGTARFDFMTGVERLDYLEQLLAKEWSRATGGAP